MDVILTCFFVLFFPRAEHCDAFTTTTSTTCQITFLFKLDSEEEKEKERKKYDARGYIGAKRACVQKKKKKKSRPLHQNIASTTRVDVITTKHTTQKCPHCTQMFRTTAVTLADAKEWARRRLEVDTIMAPR